MNEVPITTFRGRLAQMPSDKWSDSERCAFDCLFPGFNHIRDDVQTEHYALHEAQSSPYVAVFGNLISVERSGRRGRRFAGVAMERNCYYAVCPENSVETSSSIQAELAAYRNPRVSGAAEVDDLSSVSKEAIDIRRVLGSPRNSIVVLASQPEKLPDLARDIGTTAELLGKERRHVFVFGYRAGCSHLHLA